MVVRNIHASKKISAEYRIWATEIVVRFLGTHGKLSFGKWPQTCNTRYSVFGKLIRHNFFVKSRKIKQRRGSKKRE